MSNLAHKHQHPIQQQPQTEVHVKTIRRHARITPGEKILGMLLIVFIGLMAVKIVSAQAAIYEVNKDIQDIQATIQEQSKFNDDLEVQISELSKYDRISNIAKAFGLHLDENNVKVVEKK